MVTNSEACAVDVWPLIPDLLLLSKYVIEFLDSPMSTFTCPCFAIENVYIWLDPYLKAFRNKFYIKLVVQEARAMPPPWPFAMKFRSDRAWRTMSIEGVSGRLLWMGIGDSRCFFAIARVIAIEGGLFPRPPGFVFRLYSASAFLGVACVQSWE